MSMKRNKRKFRILVDMDDTLLHLSPAWEEWIQKNGDPTFTWDQVKSWNVHEWTEIKHKAYDFLTIPGIFLDLKAQDDAINTVNKLRAQGHTIHFCTSDPENSPTEVGASMSNAKIEKIEWLKHHFKWFNPETDITFSHDKGSVPGDILFDDRAKWGWEFPGVFICKDANYNKDWHGYRVQTWKEFFDLIQRLSLYLDPKTNTVRQR